MSDPSEAFAECQLPRTSMFSETGMERDKYEDKTNEQYGNLSENYTKLETVLPEETMKLEQCGGNKNISSSENKIARQDMPKSLENVLNSLEADHEGRENEQRQQLDQFLALRKEHSSGENVEGEGDEYVSSLLSVHFDRGNESNKGKQKIEEILGKLYTKHGMGESAQQIAKKSEGGDGCKSPEESNESTSSFASDTNKHNGKTSTSGTSRAYSGNGSKVALDATKSSVPKSFVSMFPKVKRQRQRPPPKTSTMYNAELTTIATADQICLNIRLKERKEKHERWKKFPQEKTKYRTKSMRKAEAEVKKSKGKKGSKAKQQQKAQEQQERGAESVSVSSSSNGNRVDCEFRYFCQFCEMGFVHKSRLKLHERCHTGEKPYPCPFCDKAFSQNGYLKTHLKIHTGEKPFHCSVCDYSFRLSTTLNRHMRVHTGECPYTCPVCEKSFNQKSTLSKHLKTHSEDKPYKCEVCKKGFKLLDTLRIHQQVHEGVRSFICSICDKAFKTKATLLTHMKTHTRDLMLLGEAEEGGIATKEDSSCSDKDVIAMMGVGSAVADDKDLPCGDKIKALPGFNRDSSDYETIAGEMADHQSYEVTPTASESLFKKEETDTDME